MLRFGFIFKALTTIVLPNTWGGSNAENKPKINNFLYLL
jgi:hypothetical protein